MDERISYNPHPSHIPLSLLFIVLLPVYEHHHAQKKTNNTDVSIVPRYVYVVKASDNGRAGTICSLSVPMY